MTNEERNIRLHEQFMGLCWHKYQLVSRGITVGEKYRIWTKYTCIKCQDNQQLSSYDEPQPPRNPNYFTMPDCWKLVEKLTNPDPSSELAEITHLKIEWDDLNYPRIAWHVTMLTLEPSEPDCFPEVIASTLPEAIIGAIERMKGWEA